MAVSSSKLLAITSHTVKPNSHNGAKVLAGQLFLVKCSAYIN